MQSEAKMGTCIKGLFWPPLEPKSESCLSPISSCWFIRRIAQVLNSGIYFTFTGCYGNQNCRQNRLKIEKLPFRPNLRLLETDFLRIRYQHKQIPKKPLTILCAVKILIICENIFLVFACALYKFLCYMSQICSKMVIFLFSAYFGGHFCYHSNCKSRIYTRTLHFGCCSNKLIRNL